ncbi:exosortase B [Roseateles chitinivorans]|uniref:Exosortase B n=1 Tax=Roseateles chitinivorans TaxID=2917965 RepID=A0A2G9C6X0_9BURK|nr:exosortase B [Roseateles chitinivorans]PIM51289.1 exosortase B [Roseateles chitinivorans]
MSQNVLPGAPGRPGVAFWAANRVALIALAIGLVALYAPTIVDFMRGPWRGDRNSHGPIVLALSAWYFYFQTRRMARQGQSFRPRPAPLAGWTLIVLGLLGYVLGRSQSVALLEMGSLMPVLLGLALLLLGPTITRRYGFAFFLLLFAVPLPASIVDVITQPMKLAASWGAEYLMYALGYPIARAGVILQIGPYQLMVADACAGLNSLFTLEALGLLYMNVVRHESVFRNIALALLIVPISYCSNVIRILILALLTYHLGDDVGQGFMHEFSGMALFLTALMLIVGVDTLLRGLSARWDRLRGREGAR